MVERKLSKISVISTGLNEAVNLRRFLEEVLLHLDRSEWQLEIIFVDDGSTDDTLLLCKELHLKDSRFHYLSLSRNFGHQQALAAGLDAATGDVVAILDADLQDPPEVIPEMIRKWKNGADVVYGTRRTRSGESISKKLSAAAYYRLARLLYGVPLPLDAGDFRLMDRAVIQALLPLRERGLFLRGMVAWAGFRQESVPYDRRPRLHGTTKYPFSKMFRFGWAGIVSFSIAPLRIATWVGIFVSLFSFLLGAWYIARKLIFNDLVPGWTALFITILFFGGLQMLFIGLLGEYQARTLEEVKGRPLYLVREGSLPPHGSQKSISSK